MTTNLALQENFISTLPRKPYVGYRKNGLRISSAKHALKYNYIEVNFKQHSTTYLIFDIDREGAAFAWEDAGLPEPTFVTISPQSGFAHLVYRLEVPVYHGEKASPKPQRLLLKILSYYGEKLQACSVNPVTTKNPFSPFWKTIFSGRMYDLGELASYLPTEGPRKPAQVIQLFHGINEEYASRGRNCNLFEVVRYWAYNRVRLYDNLEDFFTATLVRFEEENNRLDDPLPCKEVKHSARSVSRWTWKNRDNFRGGARRRERLETEALKARQRAAAEATNTKRRSKTAEAVTGAIAALKAAGYKLDAITQAVLAEAAGVSVRTVQRAWKTYKHDMRCAYQDNSPAGCPRAGAKRKRASSPKGSGEVSPSASGQPRLPGAFQIFKRFFPHLDLKTLQSLVDKLPEPGQDAEDLADCPDHKHWDPRPP